MEKELDNAEDILNNQLSEPILVHNTITTRDTDRGFSGLNAWQPLVSVLMQDRSVVIYVNGIRDETGQNSSLSLVATQQHAEASGFAKTVGNLKIGRNEITIPQITSTDVEKGGALYLQYNGNKDTDQYAVRVSSGTRFQRLICIR